MRLWCIFLVLLLSSSSILSIQSNDLSNESIRQENNEQFTVEQDRSIAKRSQRNANILYRYCRQYKQTPKFCLKYAVQMILATGH